MVNQDFIQLFIFYTQKAISLFFAQKISEANFNLNQARNYIEQIKSIDRIRESHFCFYDSIIAIAMIDHDQSDWLSQQQRIEENQKQLQQTSHNFAQDYLFQWQLVEAEKCRITKQKLEAIELYDRAIITAKEKENYLIEALGNELAAKFYLTWGKTKIAKVYLTDAYNYYHSQGLTDKRQYLAQSYPELIDLSLSDFNYEDHCYIPTDISPVGIYRCNAQGKVIYANAKTLAIKGLTLEEVLDDGWIQALHPDDRLPISNSWKTFIEQSQHGIDAEYKQEMRFIKPNNQQVVWVYSQATAQRNDLGQVTGFIGITIDVTQIKELEIAEQISTNKLNDILDNTAAVIACCNLYSNLTWQYNYYSEGNENIFGYSRLEFLADEQLWISRVVPEDAENIVIPTLQSIQERKITKGNIVFRFQHKDGSIRWVSEHFTAREDKERDCIILTTISIDITPRKKAQFKLAQSEAKLRSILENAPNFILQVDRQYRILFINRLSEGYTLEDVIGRHIREFTLPESYDIQHQAMTKVFATGEPETIEVNALGENQSKAVYEVRHAPVMKNDQVESVIVMATDITARKQATKTIESLVMGTASVTGENFFPVLAQQIAELLKVSEVLISRQKNNEQLETMAWYSNNRLINNHVYNIAGTPCETTLDESSCYCLNNIQQRYPQDEDLKVMNAESYMGVALKNKSGEAIGVLCFFDRQPLKNDPLMHNILTIFGARAAAELERLQTQKALAKLNQELEERVKKRTLELVRSEQDLRTIFNNVDDAIFIHDWQGNTLDVNARALELFGATKKQILKTTISQLSEPPVITEQLNNNLQKLRQGENIQIEWQAKRLNDNCIFDVEISLKKITLADLDVFLTVVRDITVQKQAQRQLQESRNMFKLVLDTIPLRVFWKDTQSRFLGCNPAFAQDANLSSCEEIIGNNDFDCIWKEYAHLYQADDAMVINTRVPKLNYEEPIITDNNQKKWIRTYKIPLTNSQDEVIGVLGCYEDITEQKQIEEKSRESEQRLKFALNGSENGVWDWNIEQNTVFYSPLWKKMLGYEIEEIEHTFEQWDKLVHPEDKNRCYEKLNQHLNGITPMYVIEHRLLCKDGSYKWIMARGKILKWTDDGKPLKIFGTHTDISDRKLAEQKLLEAQRFSQSIAENTPNIIYIYDLVEKRNVYANRQIYTILGYTVEEIQNMGSEALSLMVHPDDFSRATQYHQNFSKLKDEEICEFEYRIRHADGTWRYLMDRASVFKRDQEGRVIQFISSTQDITERKLAEVVLTQTNIELEERVKQRTVELEKAKQKAESANHAKTTFLANMSHELRTPLNGIMGYAQILQISKDIPVEQKKNIELIYQCGSHLLNLIEDILDISAIEAGKMQLYAQEFFLRSFLKEVLVVCQLKAQSKNLELAYTFDPSLPNIVIQDQRRLKQVLLNLLSNAIKFTNTGKVSLNVKFEVNLSNHEKEQHDDLVNHGILHIEITDTGIGLSSEQIETIFLPFEQVGSVEQKSHGTGLGLSICQRILEMMNSELKVTSTLGKGSTFYFALPITVCDQQAEKIDSPILTGNIIGYQGERKKILVIDDCLNNRKIVTRMLQPLGFIIKEASDGVEGLEKVVFFEPDLIILDLIMPNMSGWEMLTYLRQMPQGKNIQVIIFSANVANNQDFERCDLFNCNAFVSKPVNMVILLNKIAEAFKIQWIYDTFSTINDDYFGKNKILHFPPQNTLIKLQNLSKQGRLSLLIKEVKKLKEDDNQYEAFANYLQYLAEEMELKEIEQFLSEKTAE